VSTLAIKIDVDTERGTRVGVPRLQELLKKNNVPATFLFSLGPDNTGRAIMRVFRPGFLRKVSRTSVVSNYGIRTLLNGILWPGPHIGKLHCGLIQKVAAAGFEVGIHTYDHQKWQDGVMKMNQQQVEAEFAKAAEEFKRIFGRQCVVAGSPGWQANEKTLAAYDAQGILYGSDCRGQSPFFPKIGDKVFQALQIPTTLPTLDELIGLPEFPANPEGMNKIVLYYLSLLKEDRPNVLTIHPELEGMHYLDYFEQLLLALKQRNVMLQNLGDVAKNYLEMRDKIPVCELLLGQVENRSGLLAVQGNKA
jgi:undecaprenyl phosphate-alpha-L-ara4FN deformylase